MCRIVAANSENVRASFGCSFSMESLYGTYDRAVCINNQDTGKSPIVWRQAVLKGLKRTNTDPTNVLEIGSMGVDCLKIENKTRGKKLVTRLPLSADAERQVDSQPASALALLGRLPEH